MIHREFIRQLPAAQRARLTRKNNRSGLIRLFLLISLIAVSTSAIILETTLWPLWLPIQGLLLISLFHLQHECIHDTPFSTPALNRWVGAIAGFILLLPAEWFRYFHRQHHRYTQIDGKDPELEANKPATKLQWLKYVSGFPLYFSLTRVLFRYTFSSYKDSYLPAKYATSVTRQIRTMACLYAALWILSLLISNYTLVWIWVIPLLSGQPALRMYLLAEHTQCEHSDNMFRNTRTVLTHPFVRWFTWNMPYHTEHHVYPGVPFHQLPALHKLMAEHLEHTSDSYTGFNKKLYASLQ